MRPVVVRVVSLTPPTAILLDYNERIITAVLNPGHGNTPATVDVIVSDDPNFPR